MLDDLYIIFIDLANSITKLFKATAEILIANPVILIATLFFGLSAGKELKIGDILKAKF